MSVFIGLAQSYYALLHMTLVASVIAMVTYFLVLYLIPESSGNFGAFKRFLTKVGNGFLLLSLVQLALSLVTLK
jgi:hypothetical protein